MIDEIGIVCVRFSIYDFPDALNISYDVLRPASRQPFYAVYDLTTNDD
jgi:hypothetical protein